MDEDGHVGDNGSGGDVAARIDGATERGAIIQVFIHATFHLVAG